MSKLIKMELPMGHNFKTVGINLAYNNNQFGTENNSAVYIGNL